MYRAAKIEFIFGLISLSLLFVFATDAAGQSGGVSPTAEDLNGQAIQLIKEKKYQPAIELLSKAVQIKPALAEAHLNLGTAHLLSGRADIALDHMKKGLQLDPTAYQGYNQLGVVYDKLGRDDLAIETLKKAVSLKPDYAFGYFNLGKAYLFRNDLKQAEAALEKGAKLDPSNDEGKLHLAVLYAKQGRYPQAIATAQGVTQRKPDDDNANLILCKIFIMANDRESALGMYQTFKATNVPLADEMFRSLFVGQTVDASRFARP